MPNAVFVAPYLLEATARFVRAAAALPGVRLALVTHEEVDRLPVGLRQGLVAHWRVDDAFDPAQLVAAVQGLGVQLGGVERVLASLEQIQVPLAEARRQLGLPGMDPETAHKFRDKSHMKEVLSAAGVPCARHQLTRSASEAEAFVRAVGYPIVVKPPAGAGARDTFRIDAAEAQAAWLAGDPPRPDRPALLEEFLVGDEHSFDSVAINGEVVWHSVSRYLPTPLEVLRNPWMQWVVLLPRDVSGDEYAGIRSAGPAALRALGMSTGLTHMEWFRRPDGNVAISEVAARPPGAQITSLLSYAHDRDFYRAWAELMIFDRFDVPDRRWAVGAAYLRGQRRPGTTPSTGTIATVHGLDELQKELGHLVVEAQMPRQGEPPSGTYEGDGYVIVRHQDTEVVTRALARIVTGLRVELA